MAQYVTGTVNVTNGSQTVTGVGTAWLANVSVGDVFKVDGLNITVAVGSVDNNLQITLAANWTGATLLNQTYSITRDFEPNMGYREIWQGDKDWPYHLTETIREIGADIAAGGGGAGTGSTVVYSAATVSVDTTWTDVVPANHILEKIIFKETSGNAPILSLGTSDGATDLFEDIEIEASAITIVEINRLFSTSAAQSLDLNDDGATGAWNSASVNVTLLMRSLS